jgi:hypothetical protein
MYVMFIVDLLLLLECSTSNVPPDGALQYNASIEYCQNCQRDAALPKMGWCTKTRRHAFAEASECVMIGVNEALISAETILSGKKHWGILV